MERLWCCLLLSKFFIHDVKVHSDKSCSISTTENQLIMSILQWISLYGNSRYMGLWYSLSWMAFTQEIVSPGLQSLIKRQKFYMLFGNRMGCIYYCNSFDPWCSLFNDTFSYCWSYYASWFGEIHYLNVTFYYWYSNQITFS